MLGAVEGDLGERCRIGIGVNSGLVLAGTIGAGTTWELGVIGDPVNVAARVEKATRELGEPLLVTEATRCLLERTADAGSSRAARSPRRASRPDPGLRAGDRPVTISGRRSVEREAQCPH